MTKGKTLKVYVAGKMSKHSHFASHAWRDDFLKEISELTGLKFISFDPTRATKDYTKPELVFGSDVHMISQIDVLIAYLTDDFSVGGSQEILIAKYYGKPVIALAPHGGNFSSDEKVVAGEVIKDYKHPFVYSTCDVVCNTVEEVAEVLKDLDEIKPKTIKLINNAYKKFSDKHAKNKLYEQHLIG